MAAHNLCLLTRNGDWIPLTNTMVDNLAAALKRYEIELDCGKITALEQYCRLLWQWNEKLNLTRHTTFEKFAARDVVDSLALARLMDRGQRVLDVGTGGGVPGIVLAIVRPDLRVTVCESVGKKARAVQAMLTELGWPVAAYHARAEELLECKTFDTLVARAVAPLPKLLSWLEPHWGAFSQLLVIKGRTWSEECREARQQGLLKSLQLRTMSTYRTPGTQAENVILRICVREGEAPAEP
jgi:16S rRNA (guanine527-N7)-methyltransferase